MSAQPALTPSRRFGGRGRLLVVGATVLGAFVVGAVAVAGASGLRMMGGGPAGPGSMMGRGISGPGLMGGGVSGARPVMGGGVSGPGPMMGGPLASAQPGWSIGPNPGEAGFVAGTASSPRAIRVIAGPGTAFWPQTITVAAGETVTFSVTAMGPATHEFMVGPADAVAGDVEGTPEIADIGMMQTKSLTFTFTGPGPWAFACHAPGHYEAGMRGVIDVVPQG